MRNMDHAVLTVGIAPAWDLTCRGRHLGWGDHKVLENQQLVPAGKALNVARALAACGRPATAAGLWGAEDADAAAAALRVDCGENIRWAMTVVPGRTRINVTVVDTAGQCEMHLRAASPLATDDRLKQLAVDLQSHYRPGDVVVFAGSLPDNANLLDGIAAMVDDCKRAEMKVVIDSSGVPLRRLVQCGGVFAIKPNVAELGDILDTPVADDPNVIVKAARSLLDRVDMALVSRGENGAILVTSQGCWSGCLDGPVTVVSTVGCGDYLLAGFLAMLANSDDKSSEKRLTDALSHAITIAACRACGCGTDALGAAVVVERIA